MDSNVVWRSYVKPSLGSRSSLPQPWSSMGKNSVSRKMPVPRSLTFMGTVYGIAGLTPGSSRNHGSNAAAPVVRPVGPEGFP